MSFLKKLFGGNHNKQAEPENFAGEEIEYQGFVIRPTPFKSEGQFQSCGVIIKMIDGELQEYRFIRADRFSSFESAVEMIYLKGRQIIDEQGQSIFK